MSRALRAFILLILLALPLAVLVSRNSADQVAQVPTPTWTPSGGVPGIPIPESTQPVVPGVPAPGVPTSTPFSPEATVIPTPFPTATPQIPAETQILLDVANDLERLAEALPSLSSPLASDPEITAQFGAETRPEGWSRDIGPQTEDINVLVRSNLELLASILFSPSDSRPADWIGAVSGSELSIARDARHDLELLADRLNANPRPSGWTTSDPLFRCSRATQTLVRLLERSNLYELDVNPNVPNYCREVEIAVTTLVDTEILSNAGSTDITGSLTLLAENEIDSSPAVAFLDSAARLGVGVIPEGTPIRAVGRSTAAFSNMMLVTGDGFTVFVEYINTTVDERAFRRLPDVETLEIATSCTAEWCETAN